jgi:sialate O-acetylesterase
VYGERIEGSGPRYASTAARGDTLELTFTHARGLEIRADSGFEVRSADGRWVSARAVVRGSHVLVWAPDVRAPNAVRYAWRDAPPVTLWNADGLPASPFRTDDTPTIRRP